MRLILTSLFLLVSLFPLPQKQTPAPQPSTTDPEPASGAVVCPPGIYPVAPGDCVALGPSQTLAAAFAAGIPYPAEALPAYSPDRSLADSDYHYFWIDKNGTPFFSSLEDAVANQNPSGPTMYPSKHLLVSYQESATVDGVIYYHLLSGYWIHADGGRLSAYDPPYQGLQFSSQPRNAFGWVLGRMESHTAPGLSSPKSGHVWYRYNVVQIYATQVVDNLTWDLVAPNEWLDARFVGRVDPHTTRPTGVMTDRWIEVNLFEQTLSVYDHDRLVFATLVSTGVKPFWTRPGLFQIYQKLPETNMSNSDPTDFYYLDDVPWTMYFDEQRALHGAYWHNNFGSQQSHGCVNLSVGDSHWLYNWANLGDFVYVYDPSGLTPTDSSSYGAGAP